MFNKKMLYLMHVSWDWGKQRPHYIAENLNKFYDLIILHPYYYNKSMLTKNDKNGLFIKQFFTLPYYHTSKMIYALNKFLLKNLIKFYIKKYKPDFIWLTFPEFYEFIPRNTGIKIIYDCMDDALGFYSDKSTNSRILEIEKELIKKSYKIFVSCEDLATKLDDRSSCKNKTFLVRNAFGGNIIKNFNNDKQKLTPKKFKIGFVGAVPPWFDFESLNYSLNELKNIEYHIIGPVTDINLKHFSNVNFKFYGPITHCKLYETVKDFDCMIMPFKITKLINSVDPIKLYEYINYNKPIISIYYDEIERFSPFVNFYSDRKELCSILEELIKNGFKKKYSDKERIDFLEKNSWKVRVENIFKVLEIEN